MPDRTGLKKIKTNRQLAQGPVAEKIKYVQEQSFVCVYRVPLVPDHAVDTASLGELTGEGPEALHTERLRTLCVSVYLRLHRAAWS